MAIDVQPSSYGTWIAGYPGLASTAKDADPDLDGLENLLEHYLGSNPAVPDAAQALPVAARSGSTLTLTWWHLKSATDVVATAEWSETLGTWQSSGISIEVIADLPEKQQLRATLNLSPGDRARFLRLQVE